MLGNTQIRRSAGFTLIDLLIVLAIAGFAVIAVYPSFARSTSVLRLELAARQVAGALHAARVYAITRSANVAVKFTTAEDGTVTYSLFRDGDGDGVLSRDIAAGKDPEVWRERRLDYLNQDIRVGIPAGRPPRHPGNPGRRLDGTDDPIKFNKSDLASFSPIGRATPGSIYLTDPYGHLVVVRTFHLTGKITILTYDARTETWS